jgi:hypothetical protein
MMALLVPMPIPAQTRTYSIDPPGVCRVCGADVAAVECAVSGVATPGPREGGVIPMDVQLTSAVITAVGCGHVLNDYEGGDDA